MPLFIFANRFAHGPVRSGFHASIAVMSGLHQIRIYIVDPRPLLASQGRNLHLTVCERTPCWRGSGPSLNGVTQMYVI